MPQVYNTTQKNLLVASDHGQQLVRRLEYAQNADERRDTPQVRPQLRELLDRARQLAEDVSKLREQYDDGDFDEPTAVSLTQEPAVKKLPF